MVLCGSDIDNLLKRLYDSQQTYRLSGVKYTVECVALLNYSIEPEVSIDTQSKGTDCVNSWA